MHKIIYLLLIIISTEIKSYGTVLKDFLAYQEIMQSQNDLYEIDNIFTAITKDRTVDLEAKVFIKKGSQASYIVQNGRPTIFLTTKLGSWVIRENVPTPLKVSGGYTVFGIMSVDDVLGIDFADDYNIISQEKNKIILQSKNKRATYNFIELCKISATVFASILMDKNKKPIKSGYYELGTVDNIKTIVKATFKDLIFDNQRSSSFVVKSVKKSKIPIQILVPERVQLLFNQVK